MESNWTKAEFKNYSKLQGIPGDLVRMANEALAREMAVNLSAFLRTTLTVAYQSGGEIPFGEFPVEGSLFGLALVRPGDRKLLVEMQYSVLYPLVGIALGARAGSFASPDRKPTDIELQIVSLLFRLILAEAYRCWAPLMTAPLETVTMEIEPAPARALPPTEPVFAARFQLALGSDAGQVTLLAPPDLFSKAVAGEAAIARDKGEVGGSAQMILERMMAGKVAVDVWLDGSEMRLGDLLQLREGQVVRLDHPVQRRAVATLNGKAGLNGQIVSTGQRRAFQVEDFTG
ncbi:MAG TPA: FliM/FliN family flagellar motor switch protein [Bryobacteraceae bacterium]|nr:FliM/FliN family flagellar motor switch protein [Bryobacteraceae bacterium]